MSKVRALRTDSNPPACDPLWFHTRSGTWVNLLLTARFAGASASRKIPNGSHFLPSRATAEAIVTVPEVLHDAQIGSIVRSWIGDIAVRLESGRRTSKPGDAAGRDRQS